MPIVISGHMVVDQRDLERHEGHALKASRGTRWLSLICMDCEADLADLDLTPDTSLPCGCRTQEDHDEGQALQAKFRREFRITRSACVGCYLGDDGPSMHSCYIHS